MLKLETFDKSKQAPDVNCRPYKCKKKKRSIPQRKIDDLLHFVILVIFAAYTHTVCLAKSSHRRPLPSDEVINVRGFRDSELRLRDYNARCGGKYLKGYSLSGGTKAGRYVNIGAVESITDCSSLCCQKDDCNLAIMLLYPKTNTRSCFSVQCHDDYDSNGCKPVISTKSKYRPYMFKKREHVQQEGVAINRNKESGVCGPYTGSVCADNVDRSQLYYYSTHNATTLDKRLRGPIEHLRSRLTTGKCRRLALQAICYRFYPQCEDEANPKPIRICNGDCDKLIYGDCASEFRLAKLINYLRRIIPGCNSTQAGESIASTPNCIELSDESSHEGSGETSIEDEPEKSMHGRSERSDDTKGSLNKQNKLDDLPANSSFINDEKGSALRDKSPSTTPSTPITFSVLSGVTTVGPHIISTSSDLSKDTDTATTTTTTTNTTTATTTTNSTTHPSPTATTPKPTESTRTTVTEASIKNTTDIVVALSNVNEKDKVSPKDQSGNTSTTKTAAIDATKENHLIKVSLGENTEIILPLSHVNLFAKTRPKEQKEGDYTYKWSELSAPKKSHGHLSADTSKNMRLTNLDVPGIYSFKLAVATVDKEKHGVGYVNVTVKNALRINHPPRAEITRKRHVIQLPTNTVTLDGSKSTDDDKITSYKWEKLEGPINDKSVFSSSIDSEMLHLKGLVAGVYRFRLTVTDSDGATDKTETNVTVIDEIDSPPIANAGNDVVLRLPNNTFTLNGNKSSDDKNFLTYQWSKTSDSPPCDMKGIDKSQLTLSNLQQGHYVFILKVTDTSGKSSEARVKVDVLSQKNTAPTAVAGDDKEIVYPDDSTTLDASKSTSDSEIVSYHWEQISGPTEAKLTKSNSRKVHLLGLAPGTYVLKLTVTDDKNMVSTDTVSVRVKKDYNENPVAMAGADQIIYLPTRSVVIDGSKSHDDDVIDHYLWTRAGSSPAAGVVINGSDHKPILRLTDLVRGRYIFELTVNDSKGLKHTDPVTILVKEDPNSYGLVELSLYVDVDHFSEKSKGELILKISVILAVGKESVVLEEVSRSTYGVGTMMLFYVKDLTTDTIMDGKYVADILRQKIGYIMQRVEPYICRNNCSDHGYCDKSTKQCVCDSFWVANVLKSKFGKKESNCDWSILYLSVAIFGVFLLLIFISWAVCFCCARKKRNRRRARYTALRSTADKDVREEILLIPKGMKEKFSVTSLTFSDSDEDSEDETTVFDKKIISNGHIRMNGTIKGTAKYRDHGVQ